MIKLGALNGKGEHPLSALPGIFDVKQLIALQTFICVNLTRTVFPDFYKTRLDFMKCQGLEGGVTVRTVRPLRP